MRTRACLVLVILVALCAPAAAQNAPKPLTVPMKWTPNEPPGPVPPIEVTGGGLYPLKVETAIDHREKGKAVGEHPDDKKPTVSVVSDSDIPGFFSEQVSTLLKRFGVPLTTEASAKRVLRMELLEFWVIDAQSYSGTVRGRVSVVGDGNQELWSAIVTGSGENGGRSLKVINYQETFSNTIQAFAVNLVKTEAFQKSLKNQ
jgi:hypothetical protein